MESNFWSDAKQDFNPINWLSKYKRNDILYLTLMVLFYHVIGIFIMVAGYLFITTVIDKYEEPMIPITGVSVILAGPIEESVFFGIPFYATGSNIFVLAGGVVWAMFHILNTPSLQLDSLAYANWLFVIPSLFLSYRTWISGKGWFAILAHSSWNMIFFIAGCISNQFPCTIATEKNFSNDMSSIVLSIILIITTYWLFLRYIKRENYSLAA